MKFEYISSGPGLLRINVKEPLRMQAVNTMISDFQGKDGMHYLSFLYNAFTETKVVKNYKDYNYHSLYADSGGLQMITRADINELTDERKLTIYKNQGENADFGFCFDDIPVRNESYESSATSRANLGGRVFEYDRIDECGKETGKNISKQIEYFIESGSKTKAMMIVHGNTYDDYCRFLDATLKEIPKDFYDHIGGMSLSTAGLGIGALESADVANAIASISAPDSMRAHIHMLGVGSVNRLLPVLLMCKSGYIKGLERLSYDSTNQGSKYSTGSALLDGRIIQMKKTGCDIFVKMFTYMFNMYGHLMPVDNIDEYLKLSLEAFQSEKVFHNSSCDTLKAVGSINNFAFFMVHMNGMADKITNIMNDDSFMMKYMEKSSRISAYTNLLEVVDVNSYNNWRRNAKSRILSNRIRRMKSTQKTNTLSGLFS